MLKQELKRILKTRSTWWLFSIAMILCLIFAAWSVRSVTCYTYEDGTEKCIRGVEGYKLNQERYSSLEGEITPEVIRNVVAVYQSVVSEYGDNIPPEITAQTTDKYYPAYIWVMKSFSSDNSEIVTALDITPEQALGFYQARLDSLEKTLNVRYEGSQQVVSYAMQRASGNGENYHYSYGIGSTDAFDYLGVCAFLIAVICVVMTAPVFSSDYSSGADDILRCTRQGRYRLALTKLCSAALISIGTFVLCIGTFLIVLYFTFGFDDVTDMGLLYAMYNPDSMNAMDFMNLILVSGLISFLAMISFTLFLSARIKNPSAVLAISIAIILVPSLFMIVGANSNLINWFRFCLPSGGLTMSGALSDELFALRFLRIGDFVTWSPYVILVAAALQIPIWFGLAIRAYNRHQAA